MIIVYILVVVLIYLMIPSIEPYSNESICNIASIYNDGLMTVDQLKVLQKVGTGEPQTVIAYEEDKGEWDQMVPCPDNHYLCGMQAKYYNFNIDPTYSAWGPWKKSDGTTVSGVIPGQQTSDISQEGAKMELTGVKKVTRTRTKTINSAKGITGIKFKCCPFS